MSEVKMNEAVANAVTNAVRGINTTFNAIKSIPDENAKEFFELMSKEVTDKGLGLQLSFVYSYLAKLKPVMEEAINSKKAELDEVLKLLGTKAD